MYIYIRIYRISHTERPCCAWSPESGLRKESSKIMRKARRLAARASHEILLEFHLLGLEGDHRAHQLWVKRRRSEAKWPRRYDPDYGRPDRSQFNGFMRLGCCAHSLQALDIKYIKTLRLVTASRRMGPSRREAAGSAPRPESLDMAYASGNVSSGDCRVEACAAKPRIRNGSS